MIDGINHYTIACGNLNQSLDFYVRLLGLTPHARWDMGAYLTAGSTWICLSVDKPSPAQDYTHLAFNISQAHFHALAAKLRAHSVTEWKQNKSAGESVYLLDPDGHQLEIHSGTLQTRLAALRAAPYAGLQFY